MPNPTKDLELALANASVSLFREMVAYETLWSERSATVKSIAERFAGRDLLPSELLSEIAGFLGVNDITQPIEQYLQDKKDYSVLVRGCFQYPQRLLDARHPISLFYYRGDIGLLDSPAVAVVGARDCTDEGSAVANRLARALVSNGFTVATGLAKGIDTAATESAFANGGRVIGVIGTPIDEYYPKDNRHLQDRVSHEGLLISHVPFYRYREEPFSARRYHFPTRNGLMSAISLATVIVEASDRSGTLTQARACIEQGRTLCITENCLRDRAISWPARYLEKGAHRISKPSDLITILQASNGTSLDQD